MGLNDLSLPVSSSGALHQRRYLRSENSPGKLGKQSSHDGALLAREDVVGAAGGTKIHTLQCNGSRVEGGAQTRKGSGEFTRPGPGPVGAQVISGEFSLTELKLIVSHFQPEPPGS